MGFPRVLRKITEAGRYVLPENFLRSGRRERRADGKGDLIRKQRARDR